MTISYGRNVIRAALDGKTEWVEQHPVGACVVCGCTQEWGCPEGCSWIVDPHEELGETGHGLCDICEDRVQILLETPPAAWERTVATAICAGAHVNTLALALRLARGDQRRRIIRDALADRLKGGGK